MFLDVEQSHASLEMDVLVIPCRYIEIPYLKVIVFWYKFVGIKQGQLRRTVWWCLLRR